MAPCPATKRLPPIKVVASPGWQSGVLLLVLVLPLLLGTGSATAGEAEAVAMLPLLSLAPPPHAATMITTLAAAVARNAALRSMHWILRRTLVRGTAPNIPLRDCRYI